MFGEFGNPSLMEQELQQVITTLKALLTRAPHPTFPPDPEFTMFEQSLQAWLNQHLTTPPSTSHTHQVTLDPLHDTIKHSVNLASPYYFGHMDSGVLPELAVIDSIISLLNQNLLSWELATAASAIEKVIIQYLLHQFGLPSTGGGYFVSGGTIANITGILLGKHTLHNQDPKKPLEIFVSKEAHYSIKKAAFIAGIPENHLHLLPVTKEYTVDTTKLEQALKNATTTHKLIVGVAGTTNTGSIDDLETLAELAREHHAWYHVDAAYGGALMFHPTYKALLQGIQHADSLSFDPHKWMWFPKSTAILLTRNQQTLKIFDFSAAYMPVHQSTPTQLRENYGKQTIQGSRRFDSLRFWYLLNKIPLEKLITAMNKNYELMTHLKTLLEQSSVLQLAVQPRTPIVTIKLNPNLEPNPHKRAYILTHAHKTLEQSGIGWVSMTKLDTEPVLRFVILNLNATKHTLEKVFKFLETIITHEISYQNRAKTPQPAQ